MNEHNAEVAKLLREAWGWLDAEDVDEVGQILTITSGTKSSSMRRGQEAAAHLLRWSDRSALTSPSAFGKVGLRRVQSKLRLKQAELSGTHGRKRAGVARLDDAERSGASSRSYPPRRVPFVSLQGCRFSGRGFRTREREHSADVSLLIHDFSQM